MFISGNGKARTVRFNFLRCVFYLLLPAKRSLLCVFSKNASAPRQENSRKELPAARLWIPILRGGCTTPFADSKDCGKRPDSLYTSPFFNMASDSLWRLVLLLSLLPNPHTHPEICRRSSASHPCTYEPCQLQKPSIGEMLRYSHLPVPNIARVQCRAIHVPSAGHTSSAIGADKNWDVDLQAVQSISVILVFFRVRFLEMFEVGFHVLLSHLMANRSQRRKFDYPVSVVKTSERHPHTLIVSIDAGSVIYHRSIRIQVRGHIAVPNITMDQSWLDRSAARLQRPKQPRHHLPKSQSAQLMHLFIMALGLLFVLKDASD